jgi:hypothetical protein
MKKYGAIILIFVVGFFLAYLILSRNAGSISMQRLQQEPQNQGVQSDRQGADTETGNQKIAEQKNLDYVGKERSGEDVEDESYFVDDQEIFDRKAYQKKLTPLSDKEKIIWAFRLSKTTIFL